MRVAKWLTGLLYQLSLFITRSWEVHFHPRQGKVTAGRLQQRGGTRARVGRADGGRRGERLCPLGDPGPAGALGTPESVSPKHPRRLRLRGVSRNRARGTRLPPGTTRRGRVGQGGAGARGARVGGGREVKRGAGRRCC